MWKDAAKEDYLRMLGISLLRIPNGLVLGDPEEFVRKVQEALKARTGDADTTKSPLTRPASR
jgi:very-short-patch-repair endonuclease